MLTARYWRGQGMRGCLAACTTPTPTSTSQVELMNALGQPQ